MNQAETSAVGVLLVDDQAPFRDALRDLVAATEGFVLLGEADSGEAAVDAVARLAPRLVIMDKRMPGIGGVEATRQIKSRHPEIVVILTSVEEAADEALQRSCGASGFIRKRDFSPAALLDLWRTYGE
jgi:DNA-binding NarL/FixJ family response regulator